MTDKHLDSQVTIAKLLDSELMAEKLLDAKLKAGKLLDSELKAQNAMSTVTQSLRKGEFSAGIFQTRVSWVVLSASKGIPKGLRHNQ